MSELFIDRTGRSYNKFTVLPLPSIVKLLNEAVKLFKIRKTTIYGIPRGGALIAGILSILTNSEYKENIADVNLVVDDDVGTGKVLKQISTTKRRDAKFLVLVGNDSYKDKIDYFLLEDNSWLLYPWSYDDWMHLPFVATDIDDVLTFREKDKEPPENDYKSWQNYFLSLQLRTKPYFGTINAVVSGRWKTDVEITKKWLKNYDIEVRKLFLVGEDGKDIVKEKARKINEEGFSLYIESDLVDAIEISRLTPHCIVFSVETWQFFLKGKELTSMQTFDYKNGRLVI